jgi:polysaccharide pyruvyl transferase WcaK-like protein
VLGLGARTRAESEADWGVAMLVETPTQPLSSKDIEILAGHLQVLCARYPVSLGYLHGSQVRGTAHALSDVDVGFLLDNMDRKAYREMWVDLLRCGVPILP